MHEAVAAELLLRFVDEPGADGAVEQIEELILVEVDERGEHVDVELASHHRRE